jgi:pimeloyl-ACP methyl ester carboxylesterase
VPSPAPSPVATFVVGSLHITQYGSGTQALIFIPGLTCGPWEWNGQIAHFAPRYTIFALTLPGFDGQPPISGPLFPTVTADFWRFLDQKGVTKPIVIGHSLGGTMAFMLATQHPERLAGIVSLDGLPIYPASVFMPAASVKAMATRQAARMATMTAAQFAEFQRTIVLPYLVTSPQDVDAIGALVSKSDPAATGRWFEEDLTLDLRPSLAQANLPILLLAPYDATVDAQYHLPTAEAKRTFYDGIVKNAPHATVTIIPNSRHFAMYDQPQAVTDDIATFIASLGR